MNWKITLPVMLAATMVVGGASAVGVAAQESAGGMEQVGTVAVSPGPLGRSAADWSGEWLRWWLVNLPPGDQIDCALGDRGAMFFPPGAPGANVDCTIGSDQHILLPIAANVCSTDEALVSRAKAAKGNKAQKLRRQVVEDRARVFQCMLGGRSFNGDNFVTVDGEPIVIDETFFTLSTPFVLERSDNPRLPDFIPDKARFIASGYFAMLEPLDPGSHTIQSGVTWPPDGNGNATGFTTTINAEVVVAAAE